MTPAPPTTTEMPTPNAAALHAANERYKAIVFAGGPTAEQEEHLPTILEWLGYTRGQLDDDVRAVVEFDRIRDTTPSEAVLDACWEAKQAAMAAIDAEQRRIAETRERLQLHLADAMKNWRDMVELRLRGLDRLRSINQATPRLWAPPAQSTTPSPPAAAPSTDAA